MLIALTRPVSPAIAQCELTHISRQPIDFPRAAAQHAAYEQLLVSLGATLKRVPAAPDLPDSVFVEDTAIVLDEVALITRPGALSRQAETPPVASLLAGFRPLLQLQPPATLDGGDVLRINRSLYVGRSSRTNPDALHQLQTLLLPFDYRVVPVDLRGCLHLKSAATLIADNLVLINPDWLPAHPFRGHDLLPIDPAEPCAANALRLGPTLVYPSHFPRTHNLLLNNHFQTSPIDCDELAKAEGAVTCCSIIFDSPSPLLPSR